MPKHVISREIGIDYGHRIELHQSRCRSVHGHRGVVEALCEGELHDVGPQSGMILDFSFLKELMMEHIDAPCDHGLILHVTDPLVRVFRPLWSDSDHKDAIKSVMKHGYMRTEGLCGKLYLMDSTPTAENLARHWFHRLEKHVVTRSGGLASLAGIKVWETPNCWAAYGPFFGTVVPIDTSAGTV